MDSFKLGLCNWNSGAYIHEGPYIQIYKLFYSQNKPYNFSILYTQYQKTFSAHQSDLGQSHFICYIIKSICPPILGLSYVAMSPKLYSDGSLFCSIDSYNPSCHENAVYTLLFWMIKLIFKSFQRLSEERSITEDKHTHSKKCCLLTWPFGLGIQDECTRK